METTQSFRAAGSMDVLELPCDQDEDQIVIYWEEILEVFPGAQYIKDGNTIVRKLKDTGLDGNRPKRIKHHPGVVLEVVSSSPAQGDIITSPMGCARPSRVGSRISYPPGATTLSSPDGDDANSVPITTPDTGMQIVRVSQEKEAQAAFEQRLAALLPQHMQAQVFASSDVYGSIIQAIKGGHVDRLHEQMADFLQDLKDEMVKNSGMVSEVKNLVLWNNELTITNNGLVTDVRGLMTEVKDLMVRNTDLTVQNMEATHNMVKMQTAFDAKQEEMKELQLQALNQLGLLHNRVQALMTQTYELHEYPIPRLFVILPQNTSSWDPANLFSNQFRIYFLCECGEHTKSINPNIPHHIHLAKHDGYEVNRPKEFFQQYGSYVLTILRMLKFGISVAGVAIPAVSHLVHTEALDQTTTNLKALSGTLQKGMDQVIGYLETTTANDGKAVREYSDQMERNEALEGADLRKLKSFLKLKDRSKVLGELFRIVTTEGHVKWVCIDHYHENYQEQAVNDFNNRVSSLGGTFDKSVGRVKVHLRSKGQAGQFHQALVKARSVNELDITLDWDTTHNDFRRLRSTLFKSNVRALDIDLKFKEGPASDILNRSRRHDPLFEIMRHPNAGSVTIRGIPEDFVERSSLLTRSDNFLGLKQIGFDLSEWKQQLLTFRTLASRSPNLDSLTLNNSGFKVARFYSTPEAVRPQERLIVGDIGCVKAHLRSTIQAEMFYQVMENTKSIHELDVYLDWDTSLGDLEMLQDTLTTINISTLKLRVNLQGNTVGDVSDRVQKYDLILDIMQRPSTHSVWIIGAPADFIRRPSLLSQSKGFPNLRHMDIDLTELKGDIPGIKNLVSKAPNLTSLYFQGKIDDLFALRLYVAIAEYQTYPITFSTTSLHVPPSTTTPNQPLAPHEHLAYLLNVEDVQIDLVLEGNTDEEAIVDAFAKIDGSITGLKKLYINGISDGRGEQFIQDLAGIVSRSQLNTLEILLEADDRRVQVLESIQWKCLQHLRIIMDWEDIAKHAMEVLIEGKDRVKEPVELESFNFDSRDSSYTASEGLTALWRVFAASTSINTLVFGLRIAPSPMESVVKVADVSRLEWIGLSASGYSSSQVDSLLDCLTNADKLRWVTLLGYDPTEEQNRRMKDRGITLLTQISELNEYPNPRLFVVLPQDTSSWDPINLFSNKFRLYFLCECGEHTKSTNSRIPHQIHFAKHEGYEISRPTEFFGQYGRYVLRILRMLKFGISVAGVSIPALSHLVRTDALDQATGSLKALSGGLQKGVDQVISCLEKVTGDEIDGFSSIQEQENNWALEGVDLRKLETFLKNKDGNKVLGNLYRTVTSEGHFKWVCIDHYRENYREKAVRAFRDTVDSMGGSFDENIGSVTIHLRSKIQADHFYQALEKSRSVFELDIALDWDTTQSDFKKLRDTLRITSIGALRIDLKHQSGPTSGILNRNSNKRHDPILDIMKHPSTHSIGIVGVPGDFIERSSLQSRDDDFSNLRHLGIDLSALKKDIPGIRILVSRTPNLSRLVLNDAEEDIVSVCNAIAEHQTYPININYGFYQVRISSPNGQSSSVAPARTMKELLCGRDERIEVSALDRGDLVGSVMDVVSKSKENGTGLEQLEVKGRNQMGDVYIKYMVIIVSRSELRSLVINLTREEERAQILESIQWKHIRRLTIHLDKESVGVRAMKALVEGRDKEKGQVELDHFGFYCSLLNTVWTGLTALCKTFVASTSIKELALHVNMPSSDMESVLNSMDMSRLERIELMVIGYSSSKVGRVLDCLANAHNLRKVHLPWYTPTPEQKKRMRERGVTLRQY